MVGTSLAKPRVRVKTYSDPRLNLLAAAGVNVPSTTPYKAAGTGSRSRFWGASRASASAIVSWNLASVRARSRDAVRNNPHAGSAVEALSSNIVGTGVRPHLLMEDENLKASIKIAWDEWVDQCDADNQRCNFYGTQELAVREIAQAGEVFIRRRRRRAADGLKVPLQIQLLEGEHLDETDNRVLANGHVVRNGIQFDAIGARVGYWLWRTHPGDIVRPTGDVGGKVFVPAAEIVHAFHPGRIGQVRGMPWLARVLTRLKELDDYTDAELARKKTAALFAGFIKTQNPEDAQGLMELLGRNESGGETNKIEDDEVLLEPGAWSYLPNGTDIEFSKPADVGGTFEVWMRRNLLEIAAGFGITYEQLTGDLKGVNYSSIRAGLLEIRRRIEMLQQNLVAHQMCRPIWNWWILAAVQSGAVPAAGFASEPEKFRKVRWRGQGFRWVDPTKEVKATTEAIQAGLISRQQAIVELGHTAEEIDAEIAEDNERADTLGLKHTSDARTSRSAPPVPASTDGNDEPDNEPDDEPDDGSDGDQIDELADAA